jgi:hypothetical protein
VFVVDDDDTEAIRTDTNTEPRDITVATKKIAERADSFRFLEPVMITKLCFMEAKINALGK